MDRGLAAADAWYALAQSGMDVQALRREIKALIVAELDLRELNGDDIADDAALFGSGLGLDSLDALQLAMAIEERFRVQIPEGEAAKPIFASVASLAAYVLATRPGE